MAVELSIPPIPRTKAVTKVNLALFDIDYLNALEAYGMLAEVTDDRSIRNLIQTSHNIVLNVARR